MKVFIDRFQGLMQIQTGRSLKKYKSISINIGNGSWEYSNVLHTSIPAQTFVFSFSYSVNQTADIFLIGVMPDNSQEIITQAPLRQNANQGNPMFDKELFKQQQGQTKRLRLSEDVVIYLKQTETEDTRCSCISEGYDQPDVDCDLCNGTGIVISAAPSYIGLTLKTTLAKSESIVYDPSDTGQILYREQRGCWTAGFPSLSNRDILERKNGDRYYITVESVWQFDGTIINQTFNLKSIEDYSPLNVAMLPGSAIQLKKN